MKECNLTEVEKQDGVQKENVAPGPGLDPVCCAPDAEADAAQGYFQIQTVPS